MICTLSVDPVEGQTMEAILTHLTHYLYQGHPGTGPSLQEGEDYQAHQVSSDQPPYSLDHIPHVLHLMLLLVVHHALLQPGCVPQCGQISGHTNQEFSWRGNDQCGPE